MTYGALNYVIAFRRYTSTLQWTWRIECRLKSLYKACKNVFTTCGLDCTVYVFITALLSTITSKSLLVLYLYCSLTIMALQYALLNFTLFMVGHERTQRLNHFLGTFFTLSMLLFGNKNDVCVCAFLQ